MCERLVTLKVTQLATDRVRCRDILSLKKKKEGRGHSYSIIYYHLCEKYISFDETTWWIEVLETFILDGSHECRGGET